MNSTTRMVIALLVGTMMAGLAAFGVYRTIQQLPVQEVEVPGQPMVVATQFLPVGTLVSAEDVKTVGWPLDSPVPGGFAREEDVVDRGLMASVVQNEPFTESKLAPREAGGGLPVSIPSGMRAVSVAVNSVIGVAGFTVPGTRVDVLVTVAQEDPLSRIVLSNIQVLTAGTRYDLDTAREDATPIQTSVITLLVTPTDAERIALATTQGQILLVLRNPLDTVTTETNGIRLRALMAPPAPPPVTRRRVNRPPVVVAPPPPTIYTVETIRAARRTEEVVR